MLARQPGSYLNQLSSGSVSTNEGVSNGAATSARLLVSAAGFIAGQVYVDHSVPANGSFDSGDTPLPGVRLELHQGGDCSGALLASITTDASGQYQFSGLAAGTYSVCQPEQPAGTVNGQTLAGGIVAVNGSSGTPGTGSNPSATSSRIAGIVLKGDGTGGAVSGSRGNDFTEYQPLRISGQVFLDSNENGRPDGGEPGIAGQTILLSGTDLLGQPVSRRTQTDASGHFEFAGLLPGDYTLTQPDQPAGTQNGQTTAGSAGGTATPLSTTPSAISHIRLGGTSGDALNNLFGEIPAQTPDLTISKTHAPAIFTQGKTGTYTLTVTNVSKVPSRGPVVVSDTLPPGLTLAAPATGSGWVCHGAAGSSSLTCESAAVIAAGAAAPSITVPVAVGPGTGGRVLTNTAQVAGGGEAPTQTGNNQASDATEVQLTAAIEGHVWLDGSHQRRFNDPLSVPQSGWVVELLLNGTLLGTTVTGADGKYAFTDLVPGPGYQVRFRHPGTGLIFGNAMPNEDVLARPFTSGVLSANNPGGAEVANGTLSHLTLPPGVTIVEQSLPLDPAGIVYNAVTRQPVAGAVVQISGPAGFDPATHLVGGSTSMVTGADGAYQFILNDTAPSGHYALKITTYPPGYIPATSTMIPVCAGTLAVGATPNPALVQRSNPPPATSVAAHDPAACQGVLPGGAATTQYYHHFNLTLGLSAHVVNNHIPLDPVLESAIVMTKTTPLTTISKGGLVPYTVTASNRLSAALRNITVLDRIPPGFRYRSGSASLNGIPFEPQVSGRDLSWLGQNFNPGERKTFKMVLVVGAGVGEGDYVNQTWSQDGVLHELVSNVASATVRVIPDPLFDCSDLIGKVFDDKNANGYQDEGEPGIPNVRVVTARGLLVTSDAEGRFHVACAAIPQADRGSNFVMKLDERTLPSGYRLTTENPRDVRVTRGKLVKLNFGATVHRVVRLELTPAAFGEDAALRPEWVQKLPEVAQQLRARPSVLRIAYRGEQGRARLDAVAARFRDLWKDMNNEEKERETPAWPLLIETELEGGE